MTVVHTRKPKRMTLTTAISLSLLFGASGVMLIVASFIQ